MKIPKLQNVFIYTLLGFAPLSFSFIFTPFYTEYLSQEAYGLLNLFNAISGLLVPFLGLSIEHALSFMYWDYKEDRQKLNEFMSTALCLVSVIGFFVIVLGLLFGREIVALTIANSEKYTLWPFILFSLVYPFFIVQSRTFLYYYRNEGEIKKYALLNLSSLLMVTGGSILGVIVFNNGAEGAVEGRTIGFCVIVSLFMIYEFRKTGIRFNKKAAGLLLRTSLPLFFSALVGALSYVGDRMIIERMGSLALLGIYAFALTVASVVEIFLGSLSNSFMPDIYQAVMKESPEEYKKMEFSVSLFVLSIICAIVLIIAVSHPVIYLLISKNYFDSIELIPLLCLTFLPRTFTQLFTLIFYKRKKTRYILYLNIFNLFTTVILGIAFYKLMGLQGVCLGVCLSSLINMIIAVMYSEKIDSFRFDFLRLYLVSGLTFVSILLLCFIPYPSQYRPLFFFLPLLQFIITVPLICKEETRQLVLYVKKKVSTKRTLD